jgi:hypothetical protein
MLSLLLLAPISLVSSQGPYPIPGADVDISDVTPEGSALTDSTGNFMITGLGTGNFTGTISARGYLDKDISGAITQGGTTNLGDIYLDPSAVIKGTVLTHTGSPGANSMVVLLDADNHTAGSAIAGADGSFTIDTDIPTGTYSIYATPPGTLYTLTGTDACSVITTGIHATQGSTTSGITLNLLQSGTISGQVTNDLNNGIANVMVFATNNNDDRYVNLAITDSTGHYSMTANLVAGSYNVSIPMFSTITGYVFNYTDVKTLSLTTGGTATANFKLHESGSISGTVTQYDGSPAANVTVGAVGSGGIGYATTGADGTYLINTGLATGEYMVYAASDVYNPETVNVTIGELTSPVNFQLGYNLAWIAGRVSNSTSPLQYAYVEGWYEIPNPWNPSINSSASDHDTTDSSGNYRLEIHVPGNWTSTGVYVAASAEGYLDSSQNVTATKGQTTSNVNFVLQPGPKGAVSGRVVSNTAPPLLTAALSLLTSATTISTGTSLTLSGTLTPTQSGAVTIYESVNNGSWSVLTTRTLSGGTYSYSFLPSTIGIHQYYAWWPGNSEYNIAQSSVVQVNLTSEPLQTASLTISGSTSITVNTTYLVQGALSPIRSGTVTVYQSYNGSAFTAVATPTLSAGQYTYSFTPSALGTYQFYATWAGDSVTTPANSTTTTISVTAVQMTTPTLTLQSSGASVTPGQAVTLSGTISPSASGTVTLSQSINGSAYQQIANVTLSNGAYSYQHTIPAAGTYMFRASFAGNSQLNPAQSSTVTVSSAQAAATDYTWYIVGGVVVIIAIIAAALLMRPKAKPAK